MKTILITLTYFLFSAGVFAADTSYEPNGKPAPKKETKSVKKPAHKPKNTVKKEETKYLMDNGEYYIPKRKPKINYHYQKPNYKKK